MHLVDILFPHINDDARSKSHQIMVDIKISRPGWVGDIPLKVLNGKFQNKRSVGKPRKRWEDVVQTDVLQLLGKRGRRGGGDGDKGRRPLWRVRVQMGL